MAIRIKKGDKDTFYSINQVNKWIDVGVNNGILPKRANNQQHVDLYAQWADVLNKRNIIIETKPKKRK